MLIMRLVMFDKMFITGCDENCEWQLPWFLDNYYKHNDTPISFLNFGISMEMRHKLIDKYEINIISVPAAVTGWFKKPKAILAATRIARTVCWLDTDCEITGDISEIFDHYQPGKLGMVQDRPWTKRRGTNGEWHNSGVVLADQSNILHQWAKQCESNPVQGDQEVLYHMLNPIEKIGAIYSLPHTYNTLRLDYIDNIATENPLVIHHTGAKGNEVIRSKINE